MQRIAIKKQSELRKVRRHALAAQGLLQRMPFGQGINGTKAVIAHLGYVQIDTIAVVERAHHHVLFTRVPNFKPAITTRLLEKKEIFEYWAHAAAFLPIEDYRFSLPYKHAIKSGKHHWFKNPDKKLMAQLMDRITQEGPLRSRDVSEAQNKRAGWWDWKPAKKALEQLYMQGDLMVAARDGFQKTYDLPERVLPPGIDQSVPTAEEFAKHLLEQQLNCHALVSLKGITYYRRNPTLRKAVKAQVDEALQLGELEQYQLPNGEVFFARAGLLDEALPRTARRVVILSPFDNVVIQRERLKALFDYEYFIECYVPAAQRRFGYFCLPLLYGDKFIGLMDCKAHRKAKRLEIVALHLLDSKALANDEAFPTAFAKAIWAFASFQECDTISVTHVSPNHFEKVLKNTIQAC